MMRELLCGENGELQNLAEDEHIRLCTVRAGDRADLSPQ